MGMYAHLVPVSADAPTALADWSTEQLRDLLTGPGSADLDKTWDVVFPLIGSIAGTGILLVDDPIPIGDDLGFGPAQFIEPDTVELIAERLAAADEATVEAHWSELDSPFVHVEGLDDDGGSKRWAMDGYRQAAEVFAFAAAASLGVLVAIM